MGGAAMFEHVKMPELRRDAGRGAVLLHQEMKRGAVDRPLLLRQEDRTRKRSAHLQPGAERPAFFAHQVMMAGMRSLEPVDKNPISFGIIIAQLEQPYFGRAKAGADWADEIL